MTRWPRDAGKLGEELSYRPRLKSHVLSDLHVDEPPRSTRAAPPRMFVDPALAHPDFNFSQFLLTYAANLVEEIPYMTTRTSHRVRDTLLPRRASPTAAPVSTVASLPWRSRRARCAAHPRATDRHGAAGREAALRAGRTARQRRRCRGVESRARCFSIIRTSSRWCMMTAWSPRIIPPREPCAQPCNGGRSCSARGAPRGSARSPDY